MLASFATFPRRPLRTNISSAPTTWDAIAFPACSTELASRCYWLRLENARDADIRFAGGGWLQRCVMAATDLFLSLPWLFLLITVRALLPLNVSPQVSVMITFTLLGCLGWAGAARVICADARALSQSDFILLARASGSSGFRLLWRHLMPNLKPVLYAQFWISVPVFILTEANLGILGLGVAEPLPSWGSLLRELESFSTISPQAWQFVPLLLFIATVSSFHLVLTKEELAA